MNLAMALSEFEVERIKIAMDGFLAKRRPPVEIREEVDLAFRIEDQSVVIFEVRAYWRDRSQKIEQPIAKTTYVRKSGIWKIYWQRADLKWHGYQPTAEVKDIEDFLNVVDKDEHGCFWG